MKSNYAVQKQPKGKTLTDKQVKFWMIVIFSGSLIAMIFMYLVYNQK